jgi:hypothetical protein
MEQLTLKYTYADGRKASEFEPLRIDGQTIDARYVQQPDGTAAWFDRQGLRLNYLPATNGKETNQSREEDRQGNERVQSGNAAKRQTGSRQGTKGKKP